MLYRDMFDKYIAALDSDHAHLDAQLQEFFKNFEATLTEIVNYRYGADDSQVDNLIELKMIADGRTLIDNENPFDVKQLIDKMERLRKDYLYLTIKKFERFDFLTEADFDRALIYWQRPEYFGSECDPTPIVNFWNQHAYAIGEVINDYAVYEGFKQMMDKLDRSDITILSTQDAVLLHRNFKTLEAVYLAKAAVFTNL
ncbi:hypothetical protein MOO44_08405 [Nicoliella spurrieriana]|uniref:Uncharacterized protein n=1 Tax=Nicoliella spurrieriana TaxID=2925830 RepID=A0A976RS41_9LACO|nr:hypothetical protein [Nicoliella spurrieriana]UQS86870.1 hypothetical protein MOO44_08405 [Nicoliella spurrieriana]